MKTLDSLLAVSVFFLFFFGSTTSSAHAYLDPGTGSLVLQAIIAGIAGSILAIKVFWKRITKFFAGLVDRNRKKQ